jgi:hypothetical protein
MAQLLLEELFSELGESESIRRMLGEMTSLPPDVVVGKLVADVEEVIARRSQELIESLKERELPGSTADEGVEPVAPAPAVQEEPGRLPPTPPEVPVVVAPVEAHLPVPGPVAPAESFQEEREPAASAESAPPAVAEEPAAEVPVSPFWGEIERTIRGEESPGAGSAAPVKEEPAPAGEEEEFKGSLADADSGELRTATEFTDDDIVYVHGVTMVPDRDVPAEKPFMLEEKGIDGRSFAFAFDYEGMRFYLSKILPSIMNVSKTGVLLLGKQESLQVRSVHDSALNELRLHGILLPFEFGTLARGRDDLMAKADAARDRLIEAIEAMQATRWWVVRLFVLDARLAQIVGKEEAAPARRGRVVERASYTKMPAQKKYDIKVLERILGKEKRIAESVHEELKNVAERSDIDIIVGLGSGSSEDWKLILEASYEVKESNQTKFFQAVTDLQYRHLVIDLMLSVAGDAEPFSFTPS